MYDRYIDLTLTFFNPHMKHAHVSEEMYCFFKDQVLCQYAMSLCHQIGQTQCPRLSTDTVFGDIFEQYVHHQCFIFHFFS